MKEYKCTWIDETGDFHVLDYKTTDKTPAVEPPAGAVVVPFEELGMETAAPETAA